MRSTQPPTSHREGIATKLPALLRYVFLGYVVFVLLLAIAVAPFTDYLRKLDIYDFNILFLIGGIALALAAIALTKLISNRRSAHPRNEQRLDTIWLVGIIIGCILLFAVQCWITSGAYFVGNNWDPPLLTRSVYDFAKGDLPQFDTMFTFYDYLARYPNNHFLAGFFYMIERVAIACHVDPFFALDVVACAFSSLAAGLTAATIKTLTNRTAGSWGFILAAIFIGLSPWSFIPYSDSYGILIPILVIFLYVHMRHPARWALMVFLTYVGYCIKPTLIAPLGAVILVEICRAIARRRKTSGNENANTVQQPQKPSRSWTRPVLEIGIPCLLALVLAFGFTTLVKGSMGMPAQSPDRAFNVAHFLNMGANPETWGTWDAADDEATDAQGTQADKTAYNLNSWRERVSQLGATGIVKLLVKKSLTNCTEGDFDWPQARHAQSFFWTIRGDNSAIQEFYGIEDRTEKGAFRVASEDPDWTPPPWSYVAQLLWMLILAGVVLNWLRKRPTSGEAAICIALLLVCVFLLIFESGGRYLMMFSPLFCVLAVIGWQSLASRLTRAKR